jgi:hypothetical protein
MTSPQALALLALGILSTSHLALEGVAESKHDLSMGAEESAPGVGDMIACYFCHLASTTDRETSSVLPIWNRSLSVESRYTLYRTPVSDSAVDVPPQRDSLLCLSCHDGTVSPGVAVSAKQGWTTSEGNAVVRTDGRDPARDLADPHPFSITFEPSADGGLKSAAEARAAGIKFFSVEEDRVECGSCHRRKKKALRPSPHFSPSFYCGGRSAGIWPVGVFDLTPSSLWFLESG